MRYYISDCHFYLNEENRARDGRGQFADEKEMNEFMIERWNGRVRKNDEVVIIGDLSNEHTHKTEEIVKRLNGKKYLLAGNHDRYLEDRDFDRSLFEKIDEYMEMRDNGRRVILCHYPVMFYRGQYKRDEDGTPHSYMLYGHLHETFDERMLNSFKGQLESHVKLTKGFPEPMSVPCSMINCYCRFADYIPRTLDEWIEIDKERREKLIGVPLD